MSTRHIRSDVQRTFPVRIGVAALTAYSPDAFTSETLTP